jgi:cytochrome P450
MEIDVRAVLEDERYVVPPVPEDAPPRTLGWLRANVSRFSNGPAHAERRALAEREIARLDPRALRDAARSEAARILAAAGDEPVDAMALLARRVPVGVLCDELLGARPIADILAIAAAYHPGATEEQTARADAAVARLLTDDDLAAANRIGVIVQACDATAGLIGNALASPVRHAADEAIEATLRDDPPVRNTRRQRDGETVVLDLAAANLTFGHGLRPCPGKEHARQLAAGVLEAVQAEWRPIDQDIEYEPLDNLRIPARLLIDKQPLSLG